MTSVCQWQNGKCVYVRVSVCVCHSSFSLSSWVQGVCLDHITSIKVLSRSLPRKSLFTSPTLLKSLSGDAEVAGTARCCLTIRLVVTSDLTSAWRRLSSGLRSPDEADEAAGSITRLRFVWFSSNFVYRPPLKALEKGVCHAPHFLQFLNPRILSDGKAWREERNDG